MGILLDRLAAIQCEPFKKGDGRKPKSLAQLCFGKTNQRNLSLSDSTVAASSSERNFAFREYLEGAPTAIQAVAADLIAQRLFGNFPTKYFTWLTDIEVWLSGGAAPQPLQFDFSSLTDKKQRGTVNLFFQLLGIPSQLDERGCLSAHRAVTSDKIGAPSQRKGAYIIRVSSDTNPLNPNGTANDYLLANIHGTRLPLADPYSKDPRARFFAETPAGPSGARTRLVAGFCDSLTSASEVIEVLFRNAVGNRGTEAFYRDPEVFAPIWDTSNLVSDLALPGNIPSDLLTNGIHAVLDLTSFGIPTKNPRIALYSAALTKVKRSPLGSLLSEFCVMTCDEHEITLCRFGK